MAPGFLRWSRFSLRKKGLIVVSLPFVPIFCFWLLIAAVMLYQNANPPRVPAARTPQDTRAAQARARAFFWIYTLGSTGFGIAGFIGALSLSRGMRKRLEMVAVQAGQVGRGLIPDRLPTGGDEIGRLSEHLAEAGRVLREREDALNTANAALVAQTAQLAAANKELESFSYSVSHDLRAPLRAIEGFSLVLQEDHGATLGESGVDALHRVRAAATRMGMLIDEMLNLARLSRLEMQREPVDVSALATSVMGDLVRRNPDRAVNVAITDGLVAEADPRLLRIALTNLLENAWKYSSKKPHAEIAVGSSGENGSQVFHVRDNGAGFDMAYAAKLFGAFQRLHSDREFEGTGIGLATVQRVINRHGGRIWAESQPGHGATFFFTLKPAAVESPR
jgi:signal transduction histidine kinase